ncbi:MAG: LysM peptidoglycan-binding domain-containing protein [Thermoanaerobaculia bacterium]|nr:LysM peptidoglycan-binding domain-containing protein [Thermoanaerobaculia bacterium]
MADLTKVQQAVQSANVSGVRNLNARAAGNMIEIHGQADSIAAKQNAMKAITEKAGDAGLVNKIEIVRDQNAAHPQPSGMAGSGPAAAAGQAKMHTVKKGETLTHIAQSYYGKASEYKKIFEANRDKLTDPDKIKEGMTLRIP